jgi:hypothetical protein
MQPGTYAVTLGKEGYRSKTVDVKISNGPPSPITPPQSRLELITGIISLKKDPSRMRLRVNQIDGVPMEAPQVWEEAPDQPVLPTGHYTLTFDSPGYKQDIEGPIGLADGQNLTVPVKLAR